MYANDWYEDDSWERLGLPQPGTLPKEEDPAA